MICFDKPCLMVERSAGGWAGSYHAGHEDDTM